MIKHLVYGCLTAGMVLLAACSGTRKNLAHDLMTNELVFNGAPESLPAHITPYTSMARAAKYNADVSSQNTFKKIYYDDADPKDTIHKLFDINDSENKLYHALRALDFADIYALSILTGNSYYIENTIYAKSAQNLSVAAIKMHRQEIYARQTLREIDRMLSAQSKNLKSLQQKYEREGFLTEPEITYRKGLEVATARLEKLKSELLFNRSEYMKLIHTSNEEFRLEGKPFYELEDFDKSYSVDLFQDTAAQSRREFALAKEELGTFNTTKARRKAYIDYPPIARLDVNGVDIDDTRYEDALFDKAQNVVENLLKALDNTQKITAGESQKQKAFDELCATVMTQVELAYHLVKKSTFANEAVNYQIKELKSLIKNQEKKSNLADYEKVDLLNKKIHILELENILAQNSGTRAAALRSLYFYAGLSPFDKTSLKGSISELEAILKRGFNQDIVTMLTNAQHQEKWDDGGNAWAIKDNWLEQLIDEPQNTQDSYIDEQVAIPEKPEIVAPEVATAAHNIPAPRSFNTEGKTIIQLGSYSDIDNAADDKQDLLKALPSLKKYDMYFETVTISGREYHRLVFKPEASLLGELCGEIINAGFDCMLR